MHSLHAVGQFLMSIYVGPLSPIVYTSSHKILNLYVIQMLMCTSPPCSKQSLNLDLLRKMTSSLDQNKSMVKLILYGSSITQEEDVKLFTHHLLVGLGTNTTLTDLSLSLPEQCWDWLQEGEECGSFEGNYCSIVSKS